MKTYPSFLKRSIQILALVVAMGISIPSFGDSSFSSSFVEQVEQDYTKGKYKLFLKELDKQYKSAGKAGLIRQVFEKATKALKTQLDAPLSPPSPQLTSLIKERNERLLQAVSGSADTAVSRQVQSVIFFLLSPEEEKVLREFDLLKLKTPQTTTGDIQNKISALETEYYLKTLLLEIGHQRSKSAAEEAEAKKLALAFEKFDKMQDAAREKNAVEWLEKVEKARSLFCQKQTYTFDYKALEALALGKVTPQNSAEERVKEAMTTYLAQIESSFSSSQIAQN